VPTYRITYHRWTRRQTECVKADSWRCDGPWLVLERTRLVIGLPRRVVVLRVAHDEIDGWRPGGC
jgi:hypothetical protein